MRTVAALAALLLACAWAWAQDAGEPAEAVKVLGFTFGEPPPEEAVLRISAGRYRDYELKHRWCKRLIGFTDNGRVVSVDCVPNDPDAMWSVLKSRYGTPQEVGNPTWFTPDGTAMLSLLARHDPPLERGNTSLAWFTPHGTAIVNGLPDAVQWFRATTPAELIARSKERRQAVDAFIHALETELDATITELEDAEGEDF